MERQSPNTRNTRKNGRENISTGPRAVLGSQRVRLHTRPGNHLNVLSRWRLLRAEDGSRSVSFGRSRRVSGNGGMRPMAKKLDAVERVLTGFLARAKLFQKPLAPRNPSAIFALRFPRREAMAL